MWHFLHGIFWSILLIHGVTGHLRKTLYLCIWWLDLVWPFRECGEEKVSKWSSRNAGWLIYLKPYDAWSDAPLSAGVMWGWGGSWGGWSYVHAFIWSVFMVILHQCGLIFLQLATSGPIKWVAPTVTRAKIHLTIPPLRFLHPPPPRFNFSRAVTLFELDMPQALFEGKMLLSSQRDTRHWLQQWEEGTLLRLGRSDCSRLIEACQVSAEDLGFRVATLSPSLRHIPTASTHLPKINCTVLTPSSPPTPLKPGLHIQ